MSPAPAIPGSDAFRHAPLQASGLPPRILNALQAAGLSTLGDLCPSPPPCDSLDADDRALLSRVSAWCRAACAGRPPPLSLPEWLALFLTPRLADTLRIHYALETPATAIALHESTLRETGHQLGVTRERARQLVTLAFNALRQTLPLFAAEPLFRAAESALHNAGGVLDAPSLARNADPAWGGASPVGAFLLLARLLPGRLTLYRGFFSAFSDLQIERTEKALRDRMEAAGGLLPVAGIAGTLPASARPTGTPSAEPLLLLLLRHLPDTLATRDGRAGLLDRDGPRLLREVLAETGEAPLRRILDAFNGRLHPECRRGSGTVRQLLQRDPRIRKTAPGRYALPGGLQIPLPLDP
ncbi:MAG: hypothetical protein GX548_08470 [Lentisphaerae bacterium]|nr:hypothetical protein [Lentisphaerota bacterium]